MDNNEKVKQAIFDAIDDINDQRTTELHIEKTEDTQLFGENGELDSLGLVNLIVAIDEKLEQSTCVNISVADENVMSEEHSPFRSVKTLIADTTNLLQNNPNG